MNTDAMADLIVRAIRTRGRQVDTTAESAIHDCLSALVPTIIRKDRESIVRELSLLAAESEDNMHHGGVLQAIDIVCRGAPNAAE